MTMLAQSLDPESIETTLQLWEYGKFVHSDERGPGLSVPGWVRLIKPPPDREKNLKRYIGPIDPDYAYELDSVISRMVELNRNVVYLYYVQWLPIRKICTTLNQTEHTVKDARKAALHYLYGKLESTLY